MASGSQNNTTYQAQKWTNLRAFTIGDTAKNVDGTAAVSWSKDEILGASTDAYFLRGDKEWSNSLKNHFLTETNASYDIGANATRWRTGYFSTSVLVGAANSITAYNSNAAGSFIGVGTISSCLTAAGGGYYLYANGVQYGRLFVHTIGTANYGDGNNTRGSQGYTSLYLGNDIIRPAAGTAGGANNARGRIYLYHADNTATVIYSDSWNGHNLTIVGTTDATAGETGSSGLILGNSNKKSDAAAASYGYIRIYGEEANYQNIYPGAPTGNKSHYLPNATGWIVTGGNGSSTGAGDVDTPVYLKTDGTLAEITSYDGNAATATKLQTARAINGTDFNGTAAITTAKWGTARTFALTGSVTGSVSVDGSGNISLATTTNHNHDDRYVNITGDTMVGTGTATTEQWVTLTMGNNKAVDTAGNYSGQIRIYDNLGYYQQIRSARSALTANRTVYLPARDATCHLVDTTGTNASGTWAISITGFAPDVGDGSSMWIHPQSSDEINFGGTGGTKIYFGHRDIGSRAKPTDYYFGGTAASATVRAATFVGALSGNATSATSIAVTAAAENDCVPSTDRFQAFRCTSSSTGGGDGYIWAQRWSSGNYVTQIYTEVDASYLMCYRFKKNADSTWGAWKRIPMGDGTGASGTWGISITGNAATATTLQTARNINGTSFNGSANITTANWGTARNFTIKDYNSNNAGTAVSVNGSGAVTLLMPSTIYCADVRSAKTRINSNWIGFYQSNNAGGNRYGYIQCDVNRMYFRKENSSTQDHYFDFGAAMYVNGAIGCAGAITTASALLTGSGITIRRDPSSGNCKIWFATDAAVNKWRIGVDANDRFSISAYADGEGDYDFWVYNNGACYYRTSIGASSRYIKHNIHLLTMDTGNIIDRMEPVSFVFNNDPKETTNLGFIYEDLVRILPEVCFHGEGEDNNLGINYSGIIPVLVKEIQSLRKRVAILEGGGQTLINWIFNSSYYYATEEVAA